MFFSLGNRKFWIFYMQSPNLENQRCSIGFSLAKFFHVKFLVYLSTYCSIMVQDPVRLSPPKSLSGKLTKGPCHNGSLWKIVVISGDWHRRGRWKCSLFAIIASALCSIVALVFELTSFPKWGLVNIYRTWPREVVLKHYHAVNHLEDLLKQIAELHPLFLFCSSRTEPKTLYF